MGLDRNTLVGMVLIGILMVGMFYFNGKSRLAYEADQKRVQDSVELVRARQAKMDSLAAVAVAATKKDTSVAKQQAVNAFLKQPDNNTPEQLTVLENDVIKVTLTSKGAQPKSVELKKYKTFDGRPIILENDSTSKISYSINAENNITSETSALNFIANPKVENADKSQSASFTIKDSSGRQITHQYTLHPGDDYMLDFSISLNGADKLLDQNTIKLSWKTQATQVEKDVTYEKRQLQIGHIEDGKYDFAFFHK
jgi:YidC/Oxa1 family membrane protein insertase